VQVIPPKKSKKRKGVTLDLSAPAPATKRRTGKTDVKAVQDELKSMVEEIRQYKKEEYTVTIHKEFASFVEKVLPLENVDEWQPREDPKFGRLLNAMKKRIPVFKDSAAQRVVALTDAWSSNRRVFSCSDCSEEFCGRFDQRLEIHRQLIRLLRCISRHSIRNLDHRLGFLLQLLAGLEPGDFR
jgi:hypothetical protein